MSTLIGPGRYDPFTPPTSGTYCPLPHLHPGIVIMTFCDGHVESVSDDTLCSVYMATP